VKEYLTPGKKNLFEAAPIPINTLLALLGYLCLWSRTKEQIGEFTIKERLQHIRSKADQKHIKRKERLHVPVIT
jgi:hypothetical protein